MALEFDGINQSVALGLTTNLGNDTSYTLVGWFLTTDVTHSGMIYSQGRSVANQPLVTLYITASAIQYYHRGDGGVMSSTSFGISNDTLYCAVGVRRAAADFELYVNAVSRDTIAVNPGATTIDTEKIGMSAQMVGGLYMLGRNIEVRIYDRDLSLAEIESIYYSRGADNIVDGLKGRWLMNEKPDGVAASGANSVIDISGNGNHGTPVNSPVYRAAPVRLVRPVLLTPISGHFERTFTETLTLTDTVSKKVSKTFLEKITLTDTVKKKIGKIFTEKITLTDTVKITKTNLVNLIKKLIQLMDIRRW